MSLSATYAQKGNRMNQKFSDQSADLRLNKMREKSQLAGGQAKIDKQHNSGKLTARERIYLLLDPDTFVELDAFVFHDCVDFGMENKQILGDGVVTGWGKIEGRSVYLFAQDFTTFGGSLSAAHAKKISKIMDLAYENRSPLIGLNDSGGARIHEGVSSLAGYAEIFRRNARLSGVVPQISLILGPCAGGAVYSPALTDFVLMTEKNSHMFITGPEVVETVTGEKVTLDALGGAEVHTATSGVADRAFENEIEAIQALRCLLGYLPLHNEEKPPSLEWENNSSIFQTQIENSKKKIETVVPYDSGQPYDVKDVISCLVDPESFWELKPNFARNLVIGFARIQGKVIGIVANNPDCLAGVLDIDSSVKGARFIRYCDAFNIPLLTLIDVPGFLPGKGQEEGGIIRHGAKLLYAYCEATVPSIALILRKAYGGAYDVMASKHIGTDLNFAWPTAEIAVMGAEGACKIIFKKEISLASDPSSEQRKRILEYTDTFAHPYIAASKGFVDAVIHPSESRTMIAKGFEMLEGKRSERSPRKHGNIPL